MIKCIIVEDEVLAQQVIREHIKKMDQLELVAVCNNALEAAAVLEKNDVDLVFLDIQLPGMTGLHFLRVYPDPPLVILTTAYAEYALESYEFNVVDYLLKPVSFERFSKAINKLISGKLLSRITPDQSVTGQHIFIRCGNKYFRIEFAEIIYVESMKDYLRIHTTDLKLVTHLTMNEMEKLLPVQYFIRVHKSFLVAISQIRVIYGNTIELQGATLPIGQVYKNAVMSLVGGK